MLIEKKLNHKSPSIIVASSCDQLPVPTNGRVTCTNGYKVGSFCAFYCVEGYKIVEGERFVRCNENGFFKNHITPKCESTKDLYYSKIFNNYFNI